MRCHFNSLRVIVHQYYFSVVFILFLCAPTILQAQYLTNKLDSAQTSRVGFSSLFTVQPTGIKEKPFKFQLNPMAINFIQTYLDKQGPELRKMKTWAKPYFNLYDEILTANGVPSELKYLSVIESHLTSNLTSWAGAVGPWQLMPDAATHYGLKTSPVDERTDYKKSTQVASIILKELYAQFGDWLLVVAAYNCGPGRVKQAMQKKGSKDFWQIEYDLPLETRNHVKKFIATHYLFEEEDARGASDDRGGFMASDERGGYKASDERGRLNSSFKEKDKKGSSILLQTDLVETKVSGRFKLNIIADYLKVTYPSLAALNPLFDQKVAAGKVYSLKLPKDKLEIFEAHKNDILQASLQSLYSIKE